MESEPGAREVQLSAWALEGSELFIPQSVSTLWKSNERGLIVQIFIPFPFKEKCVLSGILQHSLH